MFDQPRSCISDVTTVSHKTQSFYFAKVQVYERELPTVVIHNLLRYDQRIIQHKQHILWEYILSLYKMPVTFETFILTISMWLFQVRFLFNIIPRKLKDSTRSICVPAN